MGCHLKDYVFSRSWTLKSFVMQTDDTNNWQKYVRACEGRITRRYQQFQAIPIINERFSSRSNGVEHLRTLLNSEKKFSNEFNTVVHVWTVSHSFSELLLGFKFPCRAFRGLAELPEGIKNALIKKRFWPWKHLLILEIQTDSDAQTIPVPGLPTNCIVFLSKCNTVISAVY